MSNKSITRDAQYIKSRSIVSASGCWEWSLKILKGGYGCASKELAHRVSYKIFHGDIPSGMIVRHSCDNRCCVNPRHLLLGTPKDNSLDMVTRGRSLGHERHKLAKVTMNDVECIRSLHGITQRNIASIFGISQGTVWQIVNRETWI